MTLGEKILGRRKSLGLTQFALAAKSGVSLRTVQLTEKGGSEPTLTTLRALAAALDCTESDLWGLRRQ